MPASTNEVTGLAGKGNEPVPAYQAGATVIIAVMIGYPGSTVSDILIGDHIVKVPNEDLREAHDIADEYCERNFDGG